MKPPIFKNILRFIIILVFPLSFSGCASNGSTKPNLPYAGIPYPVELTELAQKIPLFVQELGRLPEFQNLISGKKINALREIISLYKNNKDNFEDIFKEMYRIGLPEHRKYCSPLQAFFWLALDNRFDDIQRILNDYSLVNLLDSAWIYERSPVFTEEEMSIIMEGIKDDRKKNQLYEIKSKDRHGAERFVFRNIRRRPSIFSSHSKKIIKRGIAFQVDPRWSDFKKVTDRLNAPELLHYYINDNIYYKKNQANSHTPKHTFLNHWGDCDDLAVFGEYILRKGGYKVSKRYVYWKAGNRGHTGTIITLDDGSYFLAIDFGVTQNTMTGPYTNISDVDIKLSLGNNFYDSGVWFQSR